MDHASLIERNFPKPDVPWWRSTTCMVAGLLLLAVVPVLGGILRISDLAFAEAITAENARFFAAPVPIVIHIAGASLFLLLGAFQFVPNIRRRFPRWHRIAGRVALVAGLCAALAGIWMTTTYPAAANPDFLYAVRMTVGTAWAASLVLAFLAIRRRDIARHKEWMIRAYAIAAGAGTTVITFGLWYLMTGEDTPQVSAVAQAAAWGINLAVAERIIRRKSYVNQGVLV